MRSKVCGLYYERMFEKVTLPTIASTITTTNGGGAHASGSEEPGSPLDAELTHVPHEADLEHLRKLCNFFHAHPPAPGARFHSVDLSGTCHVRWERHTEMSTYTFFKPATGPGDLDSPFAPDRVPVSVLPPEWVRTIPGAVIVASHIAIVGESKADTATSRDEDEFRLAKQLLNHNGHITGAAVHRGAFRAYSDWRVHGDSFGRIVLLPMPGLAHRMAGGKVIQRLVELDKYRKMALVALPLASQLAPEIDGLMGELQAVMSEVDADESNGGSRRRQQDLLHRLCSLTALSLRHQAKSDFRFGAARAYAQIVDDRLDDLGTEKIVGVPSIRTFVQSTTRPAIRTCDSVGERLKSLARSSQLTAELMRTSLTVRQQAHSAEQLDEIKHTSKTQVLLQESVEGLSVVAITYYSCGVLGYMLKSAAAVGAMPAGLGPEVVMGAAVPIVGFTVWRGLHEMKEKVLGESAGPASGDSSKRT